MRGGLMRFADIVWFDRAGPGHPREGKGNGLNGFHGTRRTRYPRSYIGRADWKAHPWTVKYVPLWLPEIGCRKSPLFYASGETGKADSRTKIQPAKVLAATLHCGPSRMRILTLQGYPEFAISTITTGPRYKS